jgi:hypothetical protein
MSIATKLSHPEGYGRRGTSVTNQPHSLKDDELVELGFLSANPCLGRFPHVFVMSCRNTLKILAATIDPAPGLWGEYPLFRSDGSHYFLPQNGKITTDFALWKLNANQRYLLERATVGPDPQFKMFISADTPVSVLERTYEHFRESLEDATWFGDYIEYVCDWILGLRWALIPGRRDRMEHFCGRTRCRTSG